MKFLIQKLSIALVIAGLIVACSGGAGGGLAGIGGSGYIATGTVTGFGSIFVNGIEFNTDSAVFDIEDTSSSEKGLHIGMVVNIKGSINADGISGTATEVRYGDQLQGPIDPGVGIQSNPDGNTKTFTVLGTSVRVDAVGTVFEGTNFNFDSLAQNNVVEISGYYDQNQVLRATYIELKELTFNALSKVEIQGVIENLSGSQFSIHNVQVNAASANLTELENGLQNGVLVEVKGTYDMASNTINASEVEGEEISYVEGDDASIEGYITAYSSPGDFKINGIPVNAANASFEPATLQLAVGVKIEVEGQFSNGVFIATEVEAEEGEVEIHSLVGDVDELNNLFTVVPTGGTAVTITIDASTILEDDLNDVDPFRLIDLVAGNFVEVQGFETAPGTVRATRVKRREVGDTILQGTATEAFGTADQGGYITVLGVAFEFGIVNTDDTVFENEGEVKLTPTEVDDLLDLIPLSSIVLKLIDEDGDNIADKVDIE